MVGERLKKLRKERKLTQKELAEALHLSYHAISGYERNKSEPSDEIKSDIARYFNVSADYLLGLSDFKSNTFNNENKVLLMMKELSEEDRKIIEDVVSSLSIRFKETYKKK